MHDVYEDLVGQDFASKEVAGEADVCCCLAVVFCFFAELGEFGEEVLCFLFVFVCS